MSALEEINVMVKDAQALPAARSYFSRYGASTLPRDMASIKGPSKANNTARNLVSMSQNRQWVPGSRRTGGFGTNQTTIGGSAPVDTVARKSLTPYRNWSNWQNSKSYAMMNAANSGKRPLDKGQWGWLARAGRPKYAPPSDVPDRPPMKTMQAKRPAQRSNGFGGIS